MKKNSPSAASPEQISHSSQGNGQPERWPGTCTPQTLVKPWTQAYFTVPSHDVTMPSDRELKAMTSSPRARRAGTLPGSIVTVFFSRCPPGRSMAGKTARQRDRADSGGHATLISFWAPVSLSTLGRSAVFLTYASARTPSCQLYRSPQKSKSVIPRFSRVSDVSLGCLAMGRNCQASDAGNTSAGTNAILQATPAFLENDWR